MNYYLFIPLVIILIMLFPIKIQAKASFNLLSLSGAFGVFLYNKKLEHQLFWVKGTKVLTRSDKDANEDGEELDLNGEEIVFVETLIGQIKDKTRLKDIYVMYNIGLGDAFASAYAAGMVNLIVTTIFSYIKNQKPTASLGISDTVSYNREVCQFALTATLSISLFDIVYSLLRSVILSKKKSAARKKLASKDAAAV